MTQSIAILEQLTVRYVTHIARQVQRALPIVTSSSQHHGLRTRQHEHARQAIKEQASKARQYR